MEGLQILKPMPLFGRYLTPEEKVRILEWAKAVAIATADAEFEIGEEPMGYRTKA